MYLIVGLGNPAGKYSKTRHNVGFVAVEYLEKKLESPNIVLKKSDEFMNNSGAFVQKAVLYYKINTSNLYIIHDDLDIILGEYKIHFGKGPKLHNGIESVEKTLSTQDFWRIRVGIDNRVLENRIPGEAYVLQSFTSQEEEILSGVFEKITKELETKFNEK